MLRTLVPPETELLRLCNARTWDAAVCRARSHPNEAEPSEASLRGEGSTALSAAVRNGASKAVVEALLSANIHQIAITHRHRGSILHEALKYRASGDVVLRILTEMIKYQQTAITNIPPCSQQSVVMRPRRVSNKHKPLWSASFSRVSLQDRRYLSCPNLLGVPDDLCRSALHYVVERARRQWAESELAESTTRCFQKLLCSHPESATMSDTDGVTPLVLLLLTPRGAEEPELYRMVEFLLSVCPEAAVVARRSTPSWRFHTLAIRLSSGSGRQIHAASPTPLYHALLNGRSTRTVKLLLTTNRRLGQRGGAVVVSQYHEVPLHIAVTTRAPLPVLDSVVRDFPEAIKAEDVYGLNSLDWLWIRHVVDCHSTPHDFAPNRIISRRRYLANQFREWHDMESNNTPVIRRSNALPTTMTPSLSPPPASSQLPPVNTGNIRVYHEQLFERLNLLLPIAAAVRALETASSTLDCGSNGDVDVDDAASRWSLLHAACFVPCPAAMVGAALVMDREGAIRTKDDRAGRLPLHYAAGRVGYCANVPVGASRRVVSIRERPPVMEVLPRFPGACREVDSSGQLPLHIAIDTAKEHRTALLHEFHDAAMSQEELEVLQYLLDHYPGALDRRDGRTKLFPWQQAATGPFASVNTIYSLLRSNPISLVRGEETQQQ